MAAASAAEHLPKFTCAVCLNVLADPCSLSCGHSFDRYCIARSLAVKQECPTCRAPQESKNPPEVAVLLRDALTLLFPEEIAKRGKQLEEERAAERVRHAAEAAARADEARRAAAQPRALHEGSTMFAVFQMMLPTAGGQGGLEAIVQRAMAMRERAEELPAQARATRREAGAAVAGGRRAPDAAAAAPAAEPGAAEGGRGRRRARAPDAEAAAAAPPLRRQRRTTRGAAAATERSDSMPGLTEGGGDEEHGADEDEEDNEGPELPPFMEAMMNPPMGMAGLLAPLLSRMLFQRAAGMHGVGPFNMGPMHFHFEVPDGDESPAPSPPLRRRAE